MFKKILIKEKVMRPIFTLLLASACVLTAGCYSNLFVDEGMNLPPDPGRAGKQTIEGIDSDNDGLRDDVQRKIAIKYKGKPKTIKALYMYARAIEAQMVAASSMSIEALKAQRKQPAGIALRKNSGDAMYCTMDESKGYEWMNQLSFVEKIMTNTRQRWQAHDDYDTSASGTVQAVLGDKQSCDNS